jgi:hypothetical protein
VTTPRQRVSIPAATFPPPGRGVSAVLLLAALCLPALSAASPAAAEPSAKEPKPYALIFGTVWGPDDYPVYGVKVKIRRADKRKPAWELYSDHHGEFAQRVPAGKADYVVWADLKDYKPAAGKPLQAGQEVNVHIENDERADIGLHLK